MENTTFQALEERLLILFLIMFLLFMIIYRPNYNENMSNVQIVSDNKDSIIIKENNITKKVSKVCTHMGCLLSLDRANQKLICPCHGSKFGLNGEVLVGPADTNLDVTVVNEHFNNCNRNCNGNNKLLDW
jgi:nitrite reductase/ring-hydroxylating ferredoxin subunit